MRKVLAAVVAMILFGMSSAAVACDLSCSLGALDVNCSASGAHSTTQNAKAASNGMAGMDMPMGPAATAASDPSGASVTAPVTFMPCGHGACAQNFGSTAAKVVVHRTSARLLAIVSVLIAPDPSRSGLVHRLGKSPPGTFGAPDALILSLRI